MSNNEKMNIDERRKYLRLVRPRYRKAGRKEKGQLLDEMVAVTGLERKTLVHLMNGSLKRKPHTRARGKTYKAPFDDALRVIYESLDCICAERLTPNLVWMAQRLEAHHELETTPELLAQLEQVSISTVERHLDLIRQDQPRLLRQRPKPRNKLLQNIPMLCLPWNIAQPGHLDRLGSSLWPYSLRRVCVHPANDRRGHGLERTPGYAWPQLSGHGRRVSLLPAPFALPCASDSP